MATNSMIGASVAASVAAVFGWWSMGRVNALVADANVHHAIDEPAPAAPFESDHASDNNTAVVHHAIDERAPAAPFESDHASDNNTAVGETNAAPAPDNAAVGDNNESAPAAMVHAPDNNTAFGENIAAPALDNAAVGDNNNAAPAPDNAAVGDNNESAPAAMGHAPDNAAVGVNNNNRAPIRRRVRRHKPKVATKVRHPKHKNIPKFDTDRERARTGISKKEYKKKNDLISKAQVKFVYAGIPNNVFLNKSDIMVEIDTRIERLLKVVVKKGGGGTKNPVPFLNKLIYEVACGQKEKYETGQFNAGPFAKLTRDIVSNDILPRVEELLEKTDIMGLEGSLTFLSESLLRRLHDYNIEPQIPTEWDSDDDMSWKTEDTDFEDNWWNEGSSLADIEAIDDYGEFENLSDIEEE